MGVGKAQLAAAAPTRTNDNGSAPIHSAGSVRITLAVLLNTCVTRIVTMHA